ncbi:hypothetical protein DACRYDRAFT_48482 [Dacryopinax primogenitus]|uniref:C2H2-type domain-containing protein n=1 Tax=Dacryopinax primogenitus (strain DJM 731) TaxID=1858805 RepID=M5G6N0_DACPD|nr:uncharacterized protein DACRYDRAFT_48482 [Dacryopinax primogenitus]EJU04359.1 hypothetical protein DACRYDRAFT_48482 [Dacryopinax primogenitus]
MHGPNGEPLFTCLSCSIAFLTAEDQRAHYRSDHHRYNMKRRVANLPPVSATVFNQKVLDRRAETAITVSVKDTTCEICKKVYGSEGAFRAHMTSKKHRENELQAAIALSMKQQNGDIVEKKEEEQIDQVPSYRAPADEVPSAPEAATTPKQPHPTRAPTTRTPQADDDMDTDEEVEQTLEEKLAAARTHLSPSSCLFCTVASSSMQANLDHMSSIHSFFLPDSEYLADISGLLGYLAEKVAIGNVCLYCNGRGRAFHSLHAVRKHMVGKGHCKLAYDTEEDRSELGEWYDFAKSYTKKSKKEKTAKKVVIEEEVEGGDEEGDEEMGEQEWEDVSDDGEADEIIEVSGSEVEDSSESDDERPQITFGNTPYELVLPSGARIGHRSLKRYYDQSFSFRAPVKPSDPNSGAALVRKLIGDKNNQLVPLKGGFGAFGEGTEVVKARNVGEAKEAGRHVREFRDVKRREQFKTKIAFRHNSQKHFRDPLLQ